MVGSTCNIIIYIKIIYFMITIKNASIINYNYFPNYSGERLDLFDFYVI